MSMNIVVANIEKTKLAIPYRSKEVIGEKLDAALAVIDNTMCFYKNSQYNRMSTNNVHISLCMDVIADDMENDCVIFEISAESNGYDIIYSIRSGYYAEAYVDNYKDAYSIFLKYILDLVDEIEKDREASRK